MNPPAGPVGGLAATESALDVDNTAFLGLDAQPGYYAFCVSGVYQDGTESAACLPSNTVYLGGTFQAHLANCPILEPVNGVPCVFRKIYSSIGTPYHPPLPEFVPDFAEGHTNLIAILPDNVATAIDFPVGSGLTGGDGDPNNPPGVPLGIETATNPAPNEGPNPEDAIRPADITDATLLLLLNPPITAVEDVSQLRNKVYVKGRGTIVTEDAAYGATAIKVADISSFSPRGGKVLIGSRILAYKSLSAVAGRATIQLAQALEQPVLQADWKFGGGTRSGRSSSLRISSPSGPAASSSSTRAACRPTASTNTRSTTTRCRRPSSASREGSPSCNSSRGRSRRSPTRRATR